METKAQQSSGPARGLSTQRGRSGRAAALGLAVVLFGALALGLAWFARSRPASEPAQRIAVEESDEPRLENPAGTRDLVANSNTPRPAAQFPSELFDERRYEGVARLEIHVRTRGVELPASYELRLEPAPAMVGSHRAVARTLTVDDGSTTTVLDDLPLGSYSVRATAPGMEGAPQFVALAKPDELDVIIEVELYPMGFLTGRVVDSDGIAVEGIEVVLLRAGSSEPRSDATESDGTYVFDLVPDGDYRLYVGFPDAPLGELADVSFAAPSLHAPDIVVPPLGELSVRVVDKLGRPVGGALVEGNGLRSGPLKLTTDSDGRARAPRCSKGQLIFYASATRVGSGNAVAHFDPAAPAEIEIVIGG